MHHVGRIVRCGAYALYIGVVMMAATWGAHSAWSFTSVVASEVMAARHPDVLAVDPMLDRMLRDHTMPHSRGSARGRRSARVVTARSRSRY